jgi:hypothetical protein
VVVRSTPTPYRPAHGRHILSSGARLVLALIGGTLAVAAIAVAGFLLTDEPRLLCVEGELQDNPVAADGTLRPRTETFATVEEAEAFVCKRIPHPRDTGPLVFRNVEVVRTTNLAGMIEGTGRATVSFRYARGEDAEPVFSVEVSFPTRGVPDVEGPVDRITVAGHEAALVRPERAAFVYWSADGFDFAGGARGDVLSVEDMLAILDSVR